MTMLQRFRPKSFDLPTFWRDPFPDMERFFDDDVFAPMFSRRGFDRDGWMPAMDLTEEDNAFLATVELPGLTKKDIEVSVENNVVTVRGERKWEKEEEKKGDRFHRIERAYGKFERSFTLPSTVKADSVKAKFKDGVLELALPKAEESKARHVDIQ